MKRFELWTMSNPPPLYVVLLQVHNEEVEQVHTFNPVSQSVEQHFYPRPGKNNARSLPKMLVLIYKEDGQVTT